MFLKKVIQQDFGIKWLKIRKQDTEITGSIIPFTGFWRAFQCFVTIRGCYGVSDECRLVLLSAEMNNEITLLYL